MKSDPAEDIIKILYGPLEGKIYSIIKSKKKITDAGIYSILLNVPKENINAAIKSLIHEEFIEAKELVYLKDPKLPKTQKNKIIENQLIYKENYDFDNLFNAYNTLKNEVKKDFNSKEELKYECEKCQKKLDENMASRDNFKCPKCGERYKEIKNNLAELKKRCNEIFEVLDDRFDRKLGGLNKKSHANNMDYLRSKYGNNVFNDNEFKNIPRSEKGMIILENDPYVESTLEEITKTEKKAERYAFYELIEAFQKNKKK